MAVVLQDTAALNQLAVITAEAQKSADALAVQLNYEGPVTIAALEDCVGIYRQRSAEALVALGKSLLLLKELTGHGGFKARLEAQGFSYFTANRVMNAALKFGKSSNLQLLNAAANQAKILELTFLEDDEIAALSSGQTVLGLDLDDVERMGFMELRAKLREARMDKLADEDQLAKKSKKIDELSRRIKKATPDSILIELQKEATGLMNDALGCVRGQLRQACIALKGHAELYESGDQTLFMAGLLGQVQADLHALREEFALPDVSGAADAELVADMAQWAK
jgi:hypothetical protein